MDNDSKRIITELKETWHKMDGVYTLYAKSVGLNFTSILVLQFLSDFSQIFTQKDVCEKLELPKQFVNSIIKSLWEQGYVKLKEAKDRRNKDIIITESGKAYIQNVLKPLEDAEMAAWEDFSADEILSYAKTMEKYAQALENALTNSK